MGIEDHIKQQEEKRKLDDWQFYRKMAIVLFTGTIVFWVIAIPIFMAVNPPYQRWKQELLGQAELRKAESTRRILVEQARSEAAAAELQAQAIQTVGKAAQQYPEYRSQQFILSFADALQSGSVQKIIFVPTEANIPLVHPATGNGLK